MGGDNLPSVVLESFGNFCNYRVNYSRNTVCLCQAVVKSSFLYCLTFDMGGFHLHLLV